MLEDFSEETAGNVMTDFWCEYCMVSTSTQVLFPHDPTESYLGNRPTQETTQTVNFNRAEHKVH